MNFFVRLPCVNPGQLEKVIFWHKFDLLDNLFRLYSQHENCRQLKDFPTIYGGQKMGIPSKGYDKFAKLCFFKVPNRGVTKLNKLEVGKRIKLNKLNKGFRD